MERGNGYDGCKWGGGEGTSVVHWMVKEKHLLCRNTLKRINFFYYSLPYGPVGPSVCRLVGRYVGLSKFPIRAGHFHAPIGVGFQRLLYNLYDQNIKNRGKPDQ